MNEITENISAFFAHPCTISVFTALVVGTYALVIFSKTSLGKKLFSKMKTMASLAVEQGEEAKQSYSKTLAEKEKEIDELGKVYEEKLSCVLSENLYLEELIGQIGEATPNKKIASLIEKFKEEKAQRWESISANIPSLQEVEELRKEKEEAEAKAEAVIADYSDFKAEAEELLKVLRENALKAENKAEGVDNG